MGINSSHGIDFLFHRIILELSAFLLEETFISAHNDCAEFNRHN
jgi:hypothetical protein